MIKRNAREKTIDFSNNALSGTIEYSKGLFLKEFSNVYSEKKANLNQELFTIDIYNQTLSSVDFDLLDVIVVEDHTQELISFLFGRDVDGLKIKIHFIIDSKDTISLLYQVFDSYKFGDPYNVNIRIPFLANIEVTGTDDIYYFPGNPVSTSYGKEVVKPVRERIFSSDIKLPFVVCNSNDEIGFSVMFPSLSDLNDSGSTQNTSKLLSQIKTYEALKTHNLHINPDASFNDAIEIRITGIRNGWVEAFDRYREYWASNYDFGEYYKKDLKWFNECVVHNFTFLFGSEAFDHEKEQINVEKLIEQGKEFGGYDTVTIWNQYPRLGIDSRSQWDFYDDFPGGREAIRGAVEKLHQNNIYVFLPYIPWDRGMNESTNSMGDEFARILKETNADGYQLDTLNDIPISFREKLNEIRPGIVLTSQSHPSKNLPIETITTSWDEFWYFDPMPEIDVFRFICPIHIAPVISRWLRHEDKDVLIKRAIFNAAPIVIWQDIFGRWLPFSDSQKNQIKKWKKVYLEYRNVYQGMKPVPLYPLHENEIYCNVFQADDSEQKIYVFYNDDENSKTLKNIKLLGEKKSQVKTLFGDGFAELDNDTLKLEIKGKDLLHILVE